MNSFNPDRPIRFLVAHYLPDMVSGAELAIADFIDVVDENYQSTMLTPGDGKLANYYKCVGFDVWAKLIHTKRRRYPGLHTVQSLVFARELRDRDFDVVLCNTFPAASRVGMACRRAGIPYGIYVREYISDHSLHRKILDRANKILAVSRDVGNYLSDMTDPAKIVVAYDYIDAQPILERATLHKMSGNRLVPFGAEHPVVGIVGRITPYKQQDLFVRAIPGVLSEIPVARFVVVGSAQETEKDYEEYVKNLAADLGVQDKLAFMGHRKDAIEIMSELTVGCLTSSREPLARVILESQSIGCPVIASDTGGSPEMVKDEITGLLFSFKAPDAETQLSGRIVRLLNDRVLRNKIVESAKSEIQSTFAGCEHVRQLEKHLDELSKNGRKGNN